MLNSSKSFVSGVNADTLNKACQNYNESSLFIKDLEKTNKSMYDLKKSSGDDIKNICLSLNKDIEEGTNTFETSKFVVEIQQTKATVNVDIELLKNKYPQIFDEVTSLKQGYVKIGKIISK